MNSQSSQATEPGIDPEMVRRALQAGNNGTKTESRRILFRRSERTCRLTGISIRSIGSCVPDRIVSNEELELQYGFEPGWIERRSGIQQRRYAAAHEGTSDLAVTAARRAIAAADVDPAEIDLVVVGTFSPDFTCPATACLVQQKLGLDVPAMDVQAACSGFMYALATAAQFVATGNSRLALVIGADINSRIVDPTDQGTSPLFGDGAGAVLVGPGSRDQGLLSYQLGSDGAGAGLLDRPVGGTSRPLTAQAVAEGQHFLKMDGRNVFKWAIQVVTETIELILERSGCTVADVDLFVLHQANIRIIDHAMKVLGIPPAKVFNNLHRVGNTSGGSIPIALDEAQQQGLIKPGSLVMMCGFGAGLTWGTGLFRW